MSMITGSPNTAGNSDWSYFIGNKAINIDGVIIINENFNLIGVDIVTIFINKLAAISMESMINKTLIVPLQCSEKWNKRTSSLSVELIMFYNVWVILYFRNKGFIFSISVISRIKKKVIAFIIYEQ